MFYMCTFEGLSFSSIEFTSFHSFSHFLFTLVFIFLALMNSTENILKIKEYVTIACLKENGNKFY